MSTDTDSIEAQCARVLEMTPEQLGVPAGLSPEETHKQAEISREHVLAVLKRRLPDKTRR